MQLELPVCTRCCICLPLRYGLIVWGYIRLVLAILLMVGVGKSFYAMLSVIKKNEPAISYKVYAVILFFILLLTIVDFVLSVVFIIGGHTKNLKLLRSYYIYSSVLWILMSFIGVSATIYTIYLAHLREKDVFTAWVLLVDVATFLGQILIQAYVLLLVRSEIVKLTNNCEFRFVNNAAEPECKIKCEESIADEKKVTEDDCENGNAKRHT